MPKADKNTGAQQIEDKIKAIGNVLTWLLGFLALIIAGMVSFIFQGLNPLVAEYNFPTLKFAVVFLLTAYLFTAGGTLWGLGISFIFYGDTARKLKKSLEKLKFILGFNIAIALLSLFAIFSFIIYFVFF